MSRTVFCVDGPLAGKVVEIERRLNVVTLPYARDLSGITETEYHVHTFGQSTIDEETMAVVFPIWPFVAWHESDVDWARPMCKWTTTVLRREFFIGSVNRDSTALAVNSSVLLNVPPQESRYAIPPTGYCLAIDSQYR